MKRIYKLALLFVITLSYSCKTAKLNTVEKGNLNLNKQQVLKAYVKQLPEFETLQAKLKVDYANQKKKQSVTVNLRIKKNEVIWMSAPLSVVKVIITPDRVSFYNKLDNTYFDGDFSYLSKLLGTTLDFNKVQNLLLGATLNDIAAQDITLSIKNNAYVMQPITQKPEYHVAYMVNASSFKLQAQEIKDTKDLKSLQINYLFYSLVNHQLFPENISVLATDQDEQTTINLDFKNMTLNEKLSFPYKIPSDFKPIELK